MRSAMFLQKNVRKGLKNGLMGLKELQVESGPETANKDTFFEAVKGLLGGKLEFLAWNTCAFWKSTTATASQKGTR